MLITHCDDCNKVLEKDEDRVMVGRSRFNCLELCATCGAPVQEFLKSRKEVKKKQAYLAEPTTPIIE